ncbi:TonB-dependent receptor [Ornithobacterium rhinotracheale]|uniref:SusC/RagA family TonB-linked outer membrane protein n=1 Tax=Ornithobacterium rhinotracheale TaxID=28251 RepID=UPI00129CB0EF|nr:TonB-dependent receptor [Ornithobacterium rhinotracheale]MRJ10809.1 TonB-dependent receptor [Ornithobacterium rhinotracheale]
MRIKFTWSILLLLLFSGLAIAQVTGKVEDEFGPLEGAVVEVVENSSIQTVTSEDGSFEIKAKVGDKLKITSPTSLAEKIVSVKSKKMGLIKVADKEVKLDVVVGYGTQKQESVVGSVESVRAADLKVPSSKLSQSFGGRLPGVIAFQRSGMPGADGASFFIRGISTISGVTSPLILLDGVQISSGDLENIDPEIIESFSILKDATATALYGSRGANGVLIITTKSGANLDKAQISVRVEGNIATPGKVPGVVRGAEYMRLFNEAVDNLSSGAIKYTPDQIYGTENHLNPYIYPDIDWYKELLKDVAFNQKFNFNIRGGGNKVVYFMNFNFAHETGMIKPLSRDYFSFDNNINIKKLNFQNNITAKITKDTKLSLRLNAQLNSGRKPYVGVENLFGYSRTSNPVDFPITFPKDSLHDYIKWGAYGGNNGSSFNPVAELASGFRESFASTVIANLEFDQKLDFITKGLHANALASFKNWSNTNTDRHAPYNTFLLTSYEKQPNGDYTIETGLQGNEHTVVLGSGAGASGDRWYYLQFLVDWNRKFGKHDLNAMVVYNQDQYNINTPKANESFATLVNTLPKRKQSMAGRVSYAFDKRYLFEFNAGYTGSENFPKERRFGFFPSVAVGYNISEEPFFTPLKEYVQGLKIRGSWGLVGNDQIGGARFIYMPKLNLGGRSFTTGRERNETRRGPSYDRYANYDLTWEIAEKMNLGIDVRAFQSLNFKFDIFKEHRSNIFQQRGTIANYLGTGNTKIYGNTAEVENKGFDFSINYDKQINKDWYISAQSTFTYAHNKILKYDEPDDQDYPNLINVGSSLNSHLVYIAEGLFIDDNEVKNSPKQKLSSNVAAGDIKYRDIPNKDGIADNEITNNDRMRVGHPSVPEISYGFGVNVKYKKFDFGVLFHGIARTTILLSGFGTFGTNSRNNVAEWIAADHWSPSNQNINAGYPRLTQLDHANNTIASTFWLRDGSFLKLKNLELGYTYKNMRIYGQGVNLATFSKFKLWDPEQGGGNGLKYPLQRVFNIGLQIKFN